MIVFGVGCEPVCQLVHGHLAVLGLDVSHNHCERRGQNTEVIDESGKRCDAMMTRRAHLGVSGSLRQ